MRVLIFALAPLWSPHFETELELISKHRSGGDDVVVVTCGGSLVSCIANPYHRVLDCVSCRSKCDRGLAAIDVEKPERRSIDEFMAVHRRQLLPFKKVSTIEELRDIETNGINIGRGVASSLVSILRESKPSIGDHWNLIQKLLASAAQMAYVSEDAIRQHGPDLVYVFNGRFATTAPVVSVCERMRVRCRTHDAFYSTGQYSVVESGTVHSLDVIKEKVLDHWQAGSEPDRTTRAREFFDHRRHGGEGGGPAHLRFSAEQSAGKLPEGVQPGYIAILNSSEDELTSLEGYANPVYRDQIEALDAMLHEPRLRDIPFVLRVHPNLKDLKNYQTRHLRGLAGRQNLMVVPATDSVDTYALIELARAVVTFGSTTGIEAVYWRTPSVLVGRAPYEDLGPRRVRSHDDLVDSILRPPPVAPLEGALKYGFFMRDGGRRFEYFRQVDYHRGRINGVVVRANPVARTARRARNALRMAKDAFTPGRDQRQVSQR